METYVMIRLFDAAGGMVYEVDGVNLRNVGGLLAVIDLPWEKAEVIRAK